MNTLYVEVSKKSCAFVIQINEPLETLRKLSMFFLDRRIVIDSMNLHRFPTNEAMVVIHCQLEKDRVTRTVQLLEELPGVMELERLEGK